MKKAMLILGLILGYSVQAQILTKEDSLAAGLDVSTKTTVLSGYGEMVVSHNRGLKTTIANINRFVTFFGHRFSKNITLFSEIELENARVSGGSPTGDIGLEQAFLKFDINRDLYIVGGLFTPRIGITNENHLPTTFNGNYRHFVETILIPATWREIGVGVYGRVYRIPGLNYYFGVTNGLNSAGFTRTGGIAAGRSEGSNATASNIAVHAAGLYYYKNFRIQASGYYGGSAGINPLTADSLKLNSGLFGTPIGVGEVNVQYNTNKFGFKVLACGISSPEAYNINRAYANNTAELMLGGLAEVSYQILKSQDAHSKKLIAFSRYEWIDLNYRMPELGIRDDALNQKYWILGLTYKPTVGVALKLDVVNRISGKLNRQLNTIPSQPEPRYLSDNWWVNMGLAYNF